MNSNFISLYLFKNIYAKREIILHFGKSWKWTSLSMWFLMPEISLNVYFPNVKRECRCWTNIDQLSCAGTHLQVWLHHQCGSCCGGCSVDHLTSASAVVYIKHDINHYSNSYIHSLQFYIVSWTTIDPIPLEAWLLNLWNKHWYNEMLLQDEIDYWVWKSFNIDV